MADKKTAAQTGGQNKDFQKPAHCNRPPTQKERILSILKSGHTLTAYDMHQMGIMGCNARIMELRQDGYAIICQMEDFTNQYGQTVKRGRYTLAENGAAE